MKYVIVLPDGAADDPLTDLDGKTPLEAAHIPNMDWIAQNGRLGRICTIPEGFIPGTDVATLSLFSYDPTVFYTGRAPIEAAAQHLAVADDQLIFRCNFVTIEDGLMSDFTANHISQEHADQLIDALNELFADDPCQFHSGVSYRNLMLASQADELKVTCQAPHDIPGQPIADYLPQGAGAERIIDLMDRAKVLLDFHPVNQERISQGLKPATNIWLWGQGKPTILEPFFEKFGHSGAVITGVDIIRGLAVCMGMKLIEVEGATGYLDTNYAGKGKAGVEALDNYDLVVVHVEAPDEAGHEGNAHEKVKALEMVDKHIVGPLLKEVRTHDDWRILVAPDHPTPCTTKAHSSVPPPFCYAGSDVDAVEATTFCETHAQESELFIEHGHKLMGMFLKST